MNTGKKVRLGRLLGSDNRVFLVAVDHPTFGQVTGLEKLADLSSLLIKGGVDGFIANPGAIDKVLSGFPGTNFVMTIPYREDYVEFAARMGAVGIKTSYFGSPVIDEQTMYSISGIAYAAEKWGIPYFLEVEVTDKSGKIIYDTDSLKLLCRTGSELGADVIKASYIGPVEKYREVVEACNAPIVIRGGERMGNESDFFSTVHDAMASGASGAAIGRNVWQSRNPQLTAAAIWKIIHNGISVEEALSLLK
ncbi:MAG: class I fructose-bisphosphate aldolase [Nitrososphaeria archaeon]